MWARQRIINSTSVVSLTCTFGYFIELLPKRRSKRKGDQHWRITRHCEAAEAISCSAEIRDLFYFMPRDCFVPRNDEMILTCTFGYFIELLPKQRLKRKGDQHWRITRHCGAAEAISCRAEIRDLFYVRRLLRSSQWRNDNLLYSGNFIELLPKRRLKAGNSLLLINN